MSQEQNYGTAPRVAVQIMLLLHYAVVLHVYGSHCIGDAL